MIKTKSRQHNGDVKCSVCHDNDDGLMLCANCSTSMHPTCMIEFGGCSTCGQTDKLAQKQEKSYNTTCTIHRADPTKSTSETDLWYYKMWRMCTCEKSVLTETNGKTGELDWKNEDKSPSCGIHSEPPHSEMRGDLKLIKSWIYDHCSCDVSIEIVKENNTYRWATKEEAKSKKKAKKASKNKPKTVQPWLPWPITAISNWVKPSNYIINNSNKLSVILALSSVGLFMIVVISGTALFVFKTI